MARKSPSKTAPPPEPAAEAPAPVETPGANVPANIALDPLDWYLAPWRNLPPLPRPAAKPFDQKAALATLAKLNPKGDYYGWKWEKAGLSPTMSRPEAEFWLHAMTAAPARKSAEVAAEVGKRAFDGSSTEDQVRARLRGEHAPIGWVLLSLVNLLPLPNVLVALSERRDDPNWPRFPYLHMGQELAERFAPAVLPYLTAAERDELKPLVRRFINPRTWVNGGGEPVLETYLASMLGLSDEIVAMVSSLADGHYAWMLNARTTIDPVRLLLGIADPRVLIHQAKRLRVALVHEFTIRGWLANTELTGLDVIRDTLAGQTNKTKAEQLFAALALVRAPEVAPIVLELQTGSKAAAPARVWLENNLEAALAGLEPVAAGAGKLAAAAKRFIEDAKRKTAASASPAPAAAHGQAPEWLAKALAEKVGKGTLPPWADPAVFPEIGAANYNLGTDDVKQLLLALQKSTLAAPHPLVAALRERGDKAKLDAFAGKLFQLWQDAGFQSKEKWAFLACGHFGGDAVAVNLTPLIRAWPDASFYARATMGMEVLRAINTDTALVQLSGIADKFRYLKLKATAQRLLEDAAAKRGLTLDQLSDRIVPALGLGADVSRAFNYGPRAFRFGFDDTGKAGVFDASGGFRTDPPAPAKADDAAQASAALEDWKAFKKQLKSVLDVQTLRLTRAMIGGRRWSPDEFDTFFVRHPLMRHLVPRLLWAAHAPGTRGRSFFRVRTDLTFAAADGAPFALKSDASVELPHPLHLSTADRTAWATVFAAERLAQPFPQLERQVFALAPHEQQADALDRFVNAQYNSRALKGALAAGGWTRENEDQGNVDWSHLYFPSADVTATLEFAPSLLFSIDNTGPHAVPRVTFASGRHGWGPSGSPLLLGQVNPVVVSEVILFLTNIR